MLWHSMVTVPRKALLLWRLKVAPALPTLRLWLPLRLPLRLRLRHLIRIRAPRGRRALGFSLPRQQLLASALPLRLRQGVSEQATWLRPGNGAARTIMIVGCRDLLL